MACRKMISPRLLKQISNLNPSSSHLTRRLLYANPHNPIQIPMPPDRFPALPVSDKLLDQILDQTRIRIGSLNQLKEKKQNNDIVTVNEVKKILRGMQIEAVREKLQHTTRSCVSYDEFVDVCEEINGGDEEGARDLAQAMDRSGSVLVLRDVVFLRPELVAKAIQSLIPTSMSENKKDTRIDELKKMEKKMMHIDSQAEALVRRELWCGLGLLAMQTVGFMRLTFWELSWDVMEPICFFVTSFYFMAGFAFFMRTSKDPSFEGFFESRFESKRKRLMKKQNFDLDRYNMLKRDLGHHNNLLGHECAQ